MKKKKVILDLFGGTGSWSEPYRNAGYAVHVITLPLYDVLETTWDDKDIWFFPPKDSKQQYVLKVPIVEVHGILAAPPCTMFSRARTTAKTPRDFEGAMWNVRQVFNLVAMCRSKGSLKFWALENPMGMLRQFIGNPGASFRGWEYGDQHVKFTDLWGYFTMPKGRHKKPVAFDKAKYAAPKKPAQYADLKLDRAGIRAITPPRFARAFFKVNR